jgi:1-acyl-sn-glycerol-3-phosphate acyltransferase
MVVFPFIGAKARMGHVQRWSQRVLRTFRVTVDVSGDAVLANALLVANHTSWVDVFVINARYPSRFVAKSEVRAWPLIGPLSALAGTVFVARGRQSELKRTVGELARALRGGERIACFPEGTSAAQGDLQPFRANLFEAAIDAGVAAQAMAVSYAGDDGAPHPSVEYIADMSLAESMVAILTGPPIRARLHALPALDSIGETRRALALATEAQVRAALEMGDNRIHSKSEAPA